jgi:hypothetical protein
VKPGFGDGFAQDLRPPQAARSHEIGRGDDDIIVPQFVVDMMIKATVQVSVFASGPAHAALVAVVIGVRVASTTVVITPGLLRHDEASFISNLGNQLAAAARADLRSGASTGSSAPARSAHANAYESDQTAGFPVNSW